MSGIVSWIAGKVKWLLLIAAVGGPFIAFMSWQDTQRLKKIAAEGIEAQATVEGVTRTTRKRGGVNYTIDLAWKDQAGQDRKADKVSLSRAFADRIVVNDRVTVQALPVRYLAEDPTREGVVLRDDAAHQAKTDEDLVYVGAGVGVIGIIGSALFFRSGRRRRQALQGQQQAA